MQSSCIFNSIIQCRFFFFQHYLKFLEQSKFNCWGVCACVCLNWHPGCNKNRLSGWLWLWDSGTSCRDRNRFCGSNFTLWWLLRRNLFNSMELTEGQMDICTNKFWYELHDASNLDHHTLMLLFRSSTASFCQFVSSAHWFNFITQRLQDSQAVFCSSTVKRKCECLLLI